MSAAVSPQLVLLARENVTGVLEAINTGLKAGWAPEKEALLSQVVSVANRSYQKVVIALSGELAARREQIRTSVLAASEFLAAYAILPSPGFQVKLAVFDTDSTFINQEVIDEIAAYAGVKKEVAEITERAMQGELDFNAALAERVRLLKGLPQSLLPEIRQTKLSFTQGAPEFAAWLKKRGAETYLLSGGFSFFTAAFSEELGLTGNFANELEIVDGLLTGKTLGAIVNRQRKAELLRDLVTRHHVSLGDTIAVGDGANDIDMAQASGLGIAFCAKPALVNATFSAVFERDLRLIEHLLQP